MRTTLINFAKALEGHYQVMTEEMPDGIAVVIRSLDGRWVTERRFTRRQTANKELLDIILSDVRNQLLHSDQPHAMLGTSPSPISAAMATIDESTAVATAFPLIR
ncbi:hypothetical protein [Pseudomonas matsuisoli]|uniref:DUF3509 domain-containing protein n=1 Tax=Pseudomonas matsuisoli TaxID=1515666 RepID=A0A917UR96_9PSED|nr:hypothetical protein [Pseudomonas matsuisoli]GGJ78545.1 hypothetical protein GCM10009304_00550 [Pseudomonas matsuisoli]